MQLAFEIKDALKLSEGSQAKSVGQVFDQGLFPFFWTIIKNVYILTGIILFIMIVIGGVGMIANAGNAEKQKQSSQTISSALIGFFIMFSAYWIVRLIEFVTGLTILKI